MKAENRILPVYRDLLQLAGCVEEDGCISQLIGQLEEPVMLNGKRLVLPTQLHLSSNGEHTELFHVLREHLNRGESEVLACYRGLLMTRLNISIGLLFYELMQLAASTGEHNKLTPDQMDFLKGLKNVSAKTTLPLVTKIMGFKPSTGKYRPFVQMFLKRSGKWKGKDYKRLGVVTFPMYEELMASEDKYLETKISVKDRDSLLALFRYIFPDIDTPEAYNFGVSSSSQVAPTLEALYRITINLVSCINDRAYLFQNRLESFNDIVIDVGDLEESMADLNSYVDDLRTVPMAASSMKEATEEQSAAADVPAQVQQQAQPAPQQNPDRERELAQRWGVKPPAAQERPSVPLTENGGLDWAAMQRQAPGAFRDQLRFNSAPVAGIGGYGRQPQQNQPQQGRLAQQGYQTHSQVHGRDTQQGGYSSYGAPRRSRFG